MGSGCECLTRETRKRAPAARQAGSDETKTLHRNLWQVVCSTPCKDCGVRHVFPQFGAKHVKKKKNAFTFDKMQKRWPCRQVLAPYGTSAVSSAVRSRRCETAMSTSAQVCPQTKKKCRKWRTRDHVLNFLGREVRRTTALLARVQPLEDAVASIEARPRSAVCRCRTCGLRLVRSHLTH